MMGEKETLTAILGHVQDIKVEQGKIAVHLDQHRKEIDTLSLENDNMKATHNKAIGVLSVGGAALTAFFAWLFK